MPKFLSMLCISKNPYLQSIYKSFVLLLIVNYYRIITKTILYYWVLIYIYMESIAFNIFLFIFICKIKIIIIFQQ